MRKGIIAIIVCAIILLFPLTINAADITNEREYKPLDLVVVMDASGSMRDSDSKRTAPDAVRMLVNMMPAADSRVGIISFNRQPTPLTTDAKGNATLIALEDYAGVETIRDDVASVQYSGATGIGNAVFSATELLKAKSDNEHTKTIILFTDGVNDFGNNQLALSECDSNEVNAIKWAKDNNCYIYCVGYDYVENGVSSMGANGEGLLKLQNISNSTNGKFKAIHNISEIEQLLIEFLADVCDLNYKTIATIPGDGKHHECPISISPSVVEANIRIAGGAENAIANGKIKLFDPAGNEIELRNSGNVRFDKDATAASIKVIMPKAGDWLLTVEGISGDDIHVGLLEHFKMNLTSQLKFPDGNPEGVAYTNDVIGIKTWLTYDGKSLSEEAIYDAVTSAEAICVSRADPTDKKTITLSRDGLSFVGSFTIPEDCFYDITVRLDWDTVYREDTLTVASSNKPVALIKDIDNVKVNKGKTIQVKDLYSYVKDDENDSIEAYVKNVLRSDVCDLDVNGDVLTITGVKGWWAKTLVTLAFKDAQGNEVESTFEVSVGDPWATVLVVSIIILIIALVLLLICLAFRARIHLFGKMRVCEISEGSIDAAGNFTRDLNGFSYVNPSATRNNNTRVNVTPNSGIGGGQNVTAQPAGLFGGGSSTSAKSNGLFGGGQDSSVQNKGLFGGGQNAPVQNGGLFGGGQNASVQNNGLFGGGQFSPVQNGGLFGNEQNAPVQNGGMFGGGNQENEYELSNRFNEVYNFGGKRIKKTTVEAVLDGFVGVYSDFMTRQLAGGRSSLAEEVKTRLSCIRVQTSKMHLNGTVGGKGGAKLTVDKSILKKQGIVMTTPHLAKNKAELPYYDKGVVVLDFSIVTDKQNDVRKGIRVCVELERN